MDDIIAKFNFTEENLNNINKIFKITITSDECCDVTSSQKSCDETYDKRQQNNKKWH